MNLLEIQQRLDILSISAAQHLGELQQLNSDVGFAAVPPLDESPASTPDSTWKPLPKWTFGGVDQASFNRFSLFFQRTHDVEGLWANHPRDNGGPTMRGITLRTARAYFGNDYDIDDLRELSHYGATNLLFSMYYMKPGFHRLPKGVDAMVFDGAVHSGPGRSVSWLQRFLGIDTDGIIGPLTIAAVDGYQPKRAIIRGIQDIRMRFLIQLEDWDVFGNGWTNRVTNIADMAVADTL